jgi:hypothetical protein
MCALQQRRSVLTKEIRMSQSEFDQLLEAQRRGEDIRMDTPSSSAELDTRRSKSGLSVSALGGGGSGDEIIGWEDNDGGPIMGHASALPTPHAAEVALGPNDVMFGDGDEGAIAFGGPVQTAAPVAHAPTYDLVFTDDDQGGTPVDLSAYAGQSNIVLSSDPSAAEAFTFRPEDE